jgi:hypothetical protein
MRYLSRSSLRIRGASASTARLRGALVVRVRHSAMMAAEVQLNGVRVKSV